jgi:hypothetical protein
MNDDNPIAGEMDVQLEPIGSKTETVVESLERVLRPKGRAAAMRIDEGRWQGMYLNRFMSFIRFMGFMGLTRFMGVHRVRGSQSAACRAEALDEARRAESGGPRRACAPKPWRRRGRPEAGSLETGGLLVRFRDALINGFPSTYPC